jgi:hypothetical protein
MLPRSRSRIGARGASGEYDYGRPPLRDEIVEALVSLADLELPRAAVAHGFLL